MFHLHGSASGSLPPANEVCEGYVFTGICMSTRWGRVWRGGMHGGGLRGGGMHGRGHAWQGHVHGGGACMAGCVHGGVHGRGDMHGGGRARTSPLGDMTRYGQ